MGSGLKERELLKNSPNLKKIVRIFLLRGRRAIFIFNIYYIHIDASEEPFFQGCPVFYEIRELIELLLQKALDQT